MTATKAPSAGGDVLRVSVRLYVAGDGPNSTMALSTLQTLLAQQSASHVEVEVIDVLAHPEQGLREGVLVTPMLVKVAPPPERRILGNLSDRAALLALLELDRVHHD
ncbi:MAG: circadian clock protein KaiB [Myxococcaceae bacterium]|nr:circadian clock protein KaiB [Myxococcaceae bacterium]